jgi:hypothetical protein
MQPRLAAILAVLGLPITAVVVHAQDSTRADPAIAETSGVPRELWGVRLRAPIDTAQVRVLQCMTGRQFAMLEGRFDRVADDVLFHVPHEHSDSTKILAVLDAATLCAVRSSERPDAIAMVTTVADTVVGAFFVWGRTAAQPRLDALRDEVAALYGPPTPIGATGGVARWRGDSLSLFVTPRSPIAPRVTIRLADARGCAWFERQLHDTLGVPRVRYRDVEARECHVPHAASSGNRPAKTGD